MVITVAGTDISDGVEISTVRKTDNLYDRSDQFQFSYVKTPAVTKTLTAGEEIEVTHNGTTIFKGVVLRVNTQQLSQTKLRFTCDCKSLEHYLDRKVITERFEKTTVDSIISTLLTDYAPSFTDNNVDCPISVETVLFNNITLTQALDKLSRLTNFSWYVDYDYDIHFFAKEDQTAYAVLTDTTTNYYKETLDVRNDFSQIRNVVTIRGGEFDANEDSERIIGNGEADTFTLANKFKELPTVVQDPDGTATALDVGADYLEDFTNNDVLWSFQEKYVRFETAPTNGTVYEVTGTPLVPILVRFADADSISQYGTWEYYHKDLNIKSRAEALDVALAKLEAYKQNIREGGFESKDDGWQSGQVIEIRSTLFDIDERFLVQRVTTTAINAKELTYKIELATLRTVGIVEVLQNRIFGEGVSDNVDETLLSFTVLTDTMSMSDSLQAPTKTSPPYAWGDGTRWGFGTWS